ncbi:hypothetical protein ACFL27_25385 [candidate division CSSED10-310 bacterium]|uniref:PhoU domain-containing protein n=1 Tax=candidate division CSSED10-310 bacterium TaxID=2855610 RepID=A0ABV6Z513_UNCC1
MLQLELIEGIPILATEKHNLDRNKSCHLRDRDIYSRAAIEIFRRINKNITQKIQSRAGKEEMQLLTEELHHNLKKALYHASMASIDLKKSVDDASLFMEEQIIADFLLTFNAACYNIKYLISHSLKLQKLDEESKTRFNRYNDYIERMLALDENSIKKFLDQLKKRIYLFNQTMKIHQKLR